MIKSIKYIINLFWKEPTTTVKPRVYANDLGLKKVGELNVSNSSRIVYTDGDKFYLNKRRGGLVRYTDGTPRDFSSVEQAEKWLVKKQPFW